MARKKKQEEPKQEPKKQETSWRTDRPERPTLYRCRVDGHETVLQFKKCPFSGRTYWLYVDGSDVDPNAKVEWTEGKAMP